MSSRIAIEQIRKINHLIVKKNTGKPAEMVVRIDCSATTLFTYIAIMKGLGAPIRYSKERQTYYYEQEGSFVIGFMPK